MLIMKLFKKKRKQTNTYFKKFVTIGELKKFLDGFNEQEEYLKLICMLLAFTGFRISAIVTAKISSFNDDFRLLTLYEQKQKKIITRELPQPFRIYVKDYCKRNYHTFKGGYLFSSNNPSSTSKNHKHITSKSFTVFFGKRRDKLGMNHVYFKNKGKSYHRITPHSLRHFYITALINENPNMEMIKQIMGYRKAETISTYFFDPNFLDIRGEIVNNAFNKQFKCNFGVSPKQKTLEGY